jgi:PAS domain S-box-containing protein
MNHRNVSLSADDRTLIEFMAQHPAPMWVYDLESLRFLEVNPAAVEHYGYSREEFLQMTLLAIRPAEDRPRLLAHMSQPRPRY